MDNTYWHKQKNDEPLYPDMLWSKPEQKSTAGKLLIIGGNLHAFAAPAEAYAESMRAGIGIARVLLPDAAKKLVGAVIEGIEYSPSTPSGSFSQKALADFIDFSSWSDGTLIAGDLGRNSETAILLEKFFERYTGAIIATKDAVDYCTQFTDTTIFRADTTLVLSFAQLQKLAAKAGTKKPFKFDMDLLNFIENLHEFSSGINTNLVVSHHNQIHAAVKGEVVSTKTGEDLIWRVKTAAQTAVWLLQNPSKPLEAVAAAVYELNNSSQP